MSSSITRGNELGDLSVALGPKTSSPMLKGVLFIILLHFHFQFSPSKPPCFYKNLKSKTKFTSFHITVSHLCKENPSMCSTLEPLYYSSFATTVGGI